MLAYQKVVFFRAFGLTTLNSRNDLDTIIDQYDSLVTNVEIHDEEKEELLNLFKEIVNAAQPAYRNRSCELLDLLIAKFPEWKKEFLFLKTKILIGLNDMESVVKTADEYILAFNIDTDIAVLKLQALMSMDYETVVGQIEELMAYLKENMV